jgi:hypothetical protein
MGLPAPQVTATPKMRYGAQQKQPSPKANGQPDLFLAMPLSRDERAKGENVRARVELGLRRQVRSSK